MKKKIFIYSFNLALGGIETSLLGLLNAIDYSKYEVDLFLLHHEGELFNMIPKEVNLLPHVKRGDSIASPMLQTLKDGYIYDVLVRLYAKIKTKIVGIFHKNTGTDYTLNICHKHIVGRFPKIEKQYDLALSFCFPHYYTLNCIQAKKKAAWIHTDYSFLYLSRKETLPMFAGFDYIASVSDDVGQALLKTFPELESKMLTIENILSPAYVRSRSEEFDASPEIPKVENSVNLLSVGRYSHAKNFDNIPYICKELSDIGIPAKWYILGYGGDEALIRKNISEAGMDSHVIILGKKNNPYPYFKACNFYVQPSRYEGKAVTVREAQMLCKPVIITNFETAGNQLKNGHDGIIVPLDNRGCAKGIAELINNVELQQNLIKNCAASNFGNECEIQKIYGFMGDI